MNQLIQIIDGKRATDPFTPTRQRLQRIPTLRNYSKPEALNGHELAAHGLFTYQQDPSLPEGAQVDSEEWTIIGSTAIQNVLGYTDAQTLASEAEARRAQEEQERMQGLVANHMYDVAILSDILGTLGYSLPLGDIAATVAQIKLRRITGDILPSQDGSMAILERTYERLRGAMSNEDMVAISKWREGMA